MVMEINLCQSTVLTNGFTDNLSVLVPSDDAATVILGSDFRIPTLEELRELFQNTSREFITINGVNGVKLTSTINGYKNKSIFLPAAGHVFESSSSTSSGTWIEYMSSDLNISYPNSANGATLYYGGSNYSIGTLERQKGYPIRPVCKK